MFSINLVTTNLPLHVSFKKIVISYQNFQTIELPSFSSTCLPLAYSLNISSPAEILFLYNHSISVVLDEFAPVKVRAVPASHSWPWFTPELWSLKAQGRHLECLCENGLVLQSFAYHDHMLKY